MPDNYDDADEYLDEGGAEYIKREYNNRKYDELSDAEQIEFLASHFYDKLSDSEKKARNLHDSLIRAGYREAQKTWFINLRGHKHSVIRDSLGRIRKWLD